MLAPFLGLCCCDGHFGEMSLADVLLFLFVVAKSGDKITGRRSYLFVEALLTVVKIDWKGGYISGFAGKEEIGTGRPLGVKTINSETELSILGMPSV